MFASLVIDAKQAVPAVDSPPVYGRFMQIDPIGYDDQFNLYAYVGNDPVGRVDPDGKRIVLRGDQAFKDAARRDFQTIARGKEGRSLVVKLIESDKTVIVQPISAAKNPDQGAHVKSIVLGNAQNGVGADSNLYYDPGEGTFPVLGHELGHAEDNIDGTAKDENYGDRKPGTTPPHEENSMKREDQIRRENNLPERKTYFPQESL